VLSRLAPRIALALLLALPAAPAEAQAQAPSGSTDKQAKARAKGQEGLKHFAEGRWQSAYNLLAEADKLYHASTLTLYMARCQRKLGKLLEARDLYDKLIAEELPKDAPSAFLDAKRIGESERKALQAVIPTVRIVVTGGGAESPRATIDDFQVPELNKEIQLNPGFHVIEVTARGAVPAGENVTLAEGAHIEVKLELKPKVRLADAEPEPRKAKPAARPKPAVSEGGSFVPAQVAFGVGIVGLGVGAATGILALNTVSDVKSRCYGNLCLASDKEEIDTAHTLGTISTAGFIVGGAGVAAGVVLLLVRQRGGEGAQASSAALDISFGVSPGQTWISGRF
jgi:hypothetical protein